MLSILSKNGGHTCIYIYINVLHFFTCKVWMEAKADMAKLQSSISVMGNMIDFELGASGQPLTLAEINEQTDRMGEELSKVWSAKETLKGYKSGVA